MSQYRKAIYGTLVSVVGSLALLVTGDETLSSVTQGEWLVVGAEALAVFGVVFGVTNKTKLDTTTY